MVLCVVCVLFLEQSTRLMNQRFNVEKLVLMVLALADHKVRANVELVFCILAIVNLCCQRPLLVWLISYASPLASGLVGDVIRVLISIILHMDLQNTLAYLVSLSETML